MKSSNSYIKVNDSKIKSFRFQDKINTEDIDDLQIKIIIVLKPGIRLPSIKRLSEVKKIYTLTEFDHKFQATKESEKAVKKFANQYSLTFVKSDLKKWTVTLMGSVTNLNKAFRLELGVYNCPHEDEMIFGHHDPYYIPGWLKKHVTGVLGLSKLKLHHNIKHKKDLAIKVNADYQEKGNKKNTLSSSVQNCDSEFIKDFQGWASVLNKLNGLYANQYADLYNFPRSDGEGVCVGIIQLGGGYFLSDIKEYLKKCKIKSKLDIHDVSSMRVSNCPCGNHEENAMDRVLSFFEGSMDIQILIGIVPAARIVNYFSENSSEGVYQAFMDAASDTVNKPDVLTISWGGPEQYSYSKNQIDSINQALKKLAMLGITTFASSGDAGSSNGMEGEFAVNFPASSPHVIACGGTTLEIKNGKIHHEEVWNGILKNGDQEKPFASGGGFSNFSRQPFYQRSVITSLNHNNTKRGIPDIAANADFSKMSYRVMTGGIMVGGGGTSAAAPLWAGLAVRYCQILGKRLPYFNYFLYSIAGKKTFHQILRTNNILQGSGVKNYNAGKPWNPCTGLGTPDGRLLLKELKSYLNKKSNKVLICSK